AQLAQVRALASKGTARQGTAALYARAMGYPGLQDGRPPRSRAGAGLPDDPVPGEMPGEEAAGYGPPPVPGADGVPWRDHGTAERPAYAGPGNDAPGNGAPGNGAPGNGAPGNG